MGSRTRSTHPTAEPPTNPLLVRVFPDDDFQVLHAPLQGDVVGGVEEVEAVALDRAASVEDGDRVAFVVAGDGEDRAEGDRWVGGGELHAVGPDAHARGGDAVGPDAARLFVGAVGGGGHGDGADGADGSAVEGGAGPDFAVD